MFEQNVYDMGKENPCVTGQQNSHPSMAPRTRRSTAKEIEPQNEHMDREDRDYDEEIARVSDDSELSDDSEDDDPSFNVRGKEAYGGVEMLKVDQCKIYLRKYGLRLTGKKDVLVGRIKEHLEYIEVLWSEGAKPLPALHPLLIKGRNLYKLKTMRQRWPNEMERCSIVQEKHLRGSRARLSREARVQLKEMRKKLATSKRTKKSGGITSNQQKNVLPPLFPEIVPAAPAFTKNGPFQGNAWLASRNMHNQGGVQRPLSGPQYALPSVNSQIPQYSSCLSFLPESSGAGMYHIDTNFMSRASNVQPAENIPNLCTNQRFPSHHHRNLCGNGQQRQPLASLNSCSQPCNRQQINKQQVCRHFVRGSCYFGDSCKFVHDRR
ncbi:Zinc finger CCCH domain-containing protein 62 [Nymphaea thermarum]|nr:Zinc finger CCCH domain-containing protein 62 [Nymphaea thermarum]